MAISQENTARSKMITGQIITGDVNDEKIISALNTIERELFVPDIFRNVAYVDEDISMGNGRFLMEPLIFARILKYADIKKNETVLDIGCTTGYSAAVISLLAQNVVALEEDALFMNKAKNLLSAYSNVELFESSLVNGVSAKSPYDVIIVEGAIEFLPQALSDQLCEGGRLLVIENVEGAKTTMSGLGKLVEYKKIKNILYKTALHDASAPLIPSFKKTLSFKF